MAVGVHSVFLALLCAALPAVATYTNPAITNSVFETQVFLYDGQYHAVYTDMSTYNYFWLATSTDLISWTSPTKIFLTGSRPDGIVNDELLSPHIANVNGRWLLYYRDKANGASRIGVARAGSSLTAAYTAGNVSIASGGGGTQDPFVVKEEGTSNYYLFFYQGRVIKAQRLQADGLGLAGPLYTIATASGSCPRADE